MEETLSNNPTEMSIQEKARAFMNGMRREIESIGNKALAKSKTAIQKPKVTRIVVCFSERSEFESDMLTGLVVDSYLQCAKGEVGFVIPAAFRDLLLPLLLSLPCSYREFRSSGNPESTASNITGGKE